jgi:hypothetical protein
MMKRLLDSRTTAVSLRQFSSFSSFAMVRLNWVAAAGGAVEATTGGRRTVMAAAMADWAVVGGGGALGSVEEE